jgi:hypothetical protein
MCLYYLGNAKIEKSIDILNYTILRGFMKD